MKKNHFFIPLFLSLLLSTAYAKKTEEGAFLGPNDPLLEATIGHSPFGTSFQIPPENEEAPAEEELEGIEYFKSEIDKKRLAHGCGTSSKLAGKSVTANYPEGIVANGLAMLKSHCGQFDEIPGWIGNFYKTRRQRIYNALSSGAGNPNKDVFAHKHLGQDIRNPQAGKELSSEDRLHNLVETYSMVTSLFARESDYRLQRGVDMSKGQKRKNNKEEDEGGPAQVAWGSIGSKPAILNPRKALYNEYRETHKTDMDRQKACFNPSKYEKLARADVSTGRSAFYGMHKSCWAFTAEYAALNTRLNFCENGPLKFKSNDSNRTYCGKKYGPGSEDNLTHWQEAKIDDSCRSMMKDVAGMTAQLKDRKSCSQVFPDLYRHRADEDEKLPRREKVKKYKSNLMAAITHGFGCNSNDSKNRDASDFGDLIIANEMSRPSQMGIPRIRLHDLKKDTQANADMIEMRCKGTSGCAEKIKQVRDAVVDALIKKDPQALKDAFALEKKLGAGYKCRADQVPEVASKMDMPERQTTLFAQERAPAQTKLGSSQNSSSDKANESEKVAKREDLAGFLASMSHRYGCSSFGSKLNGSELAKFARENPEAWSKTNFEHYATESAKSRCDLAKTAQSKKDCFNELKPVFKRTLENLGNSTALSSIGSSGKDAYSCRWQMVNQRKSEYLSKDWL